MKIFFVAQRVPYPPDRGDKIATFNEIRHLSEAHEVHVFCLADGKADLANVDGLRGFTRSVTAVPVRRLAGNVRVLTAAATGTPLSVAYFDEGELHRVVAEQFAQMAPDLFLVYSSNVAQFALPFSHTPRVMHFSDLDSLKWEQFAARARPPMKWVYALEARRLLAHERRIAAAFSHSLVCTEKEKRDFEALIPGAQVSCVPNGVDLDFFRSEGRAKVPGRLAFTGVMDYFPNVDGVVWFCEKILPKVQAAVPDATFTICGSRPNDAVKALAARPGVTVTGRVPDVRPYLDEAEVAVVPLRMARGIQNKLLEALAMGLPAVATTATWQGTSVPEGDGILVADDPDAFAAAVIRLLQDPDERAAMAAKARHEVETRYSWDTQLAKLDEIIARVVARKA